MNKTERAIIDSGLFTLVVDNESPTNGRETVYVNKSRGAVAMTFSIRKDDVVSMYFDRGGERYYHGGFYDHSELTNYILPVMKSDKAWAHWFSTDDNSCDFTLSVDYVV